VTVPKNTHRAKRAIKTAREVKCYSLENHFSGQPLTEKPVVWGGPIVDCRHTQLIEVSQAEYLTRELNGHNCKLVAGENGFYTLRVHSNLWYTFKAAVPA
jgi:hypothetical protein